MKRVFILLGTVLLLAGNAYAVGIGPYLDLSGGGGELEFDSDPSTYDINTGGFGLGFALDTAPGTDSVFNYRLNLGIHGQSLEFDINDDAVISMGGVVFENVFGFAVVQRPKLRWWIGPLVRLAYYGEGETDDFYDAGSWMKIETEDVVEFGVGAATGINLKVGRMYLCPSTGFRWIGGSGEATIIDYTLATRDKTDFDFGLFEGFFNFALLF